MMRVKVRAPVSYRLWLIEDLVADAIFGQELKPCSDCLDYRWLDRLVVTVKLKGILHTFA